MAAQGASRSVLDERSAQVERLAGSALHGSESLSRLLRYLANRAILDPGNTIREHEIASEVFGRGTAFDPRLDSMVRVSVTRLRAKLLEYYSGVGSNDPIVVELPKGSYTLVFHSKSADGPIAGPELLERETGPVTLPVPVEPAERTAAPPPAETGSNRLNRWLLAAFVSATAIAAMLAATLLVEHSRRSESNSAAAPDAPSVRRFWGLLLNHPGEPWVVFSNAAFVGAPATGMRYMVPARDSGREVLDLYTGIGEVLGIHALDRTFSMLNRSMRVKRGGLLSLDDVESNDVVYVGSPLENLTLRDVPGLQDFQFQILEEGPQAGQGTLVSRAPRPGETRMFLPSPLPLTRDFAVIALVPGLNPSRWSLILAGTSTIGTQGAVEYVCREDTVRDLLGRMGTAGSPRPTFEAVIEIQIKGGVPIHSSIVAFHARQAGSRS
jgi:hypothetical protein